jgi:peptidoglycan/xylan/chitin deacetylase (PgdA/CDA1 family)
MLREAPWSGVRRLAEAFERHGAHATFFIVGRAAEGGRRQVRWLADHGFEVGSHGYRHVKFELSGDVDRDIAESVRALGTLGIHPAGLRPPHLVTDYGKLKELTGLSIYQIAAHNGFKYVSSSNGLGPHEEDGVWELPCTWHDVWDFSRPEPTDEEVYAGISPVLQDGATLLFHGHFTGQAARSKLLGRILGKGNCNFVSASEFIKNREGVILTVDVGAFTRRNLIRRFCFG